MPNAPPRNAIQSGKPGGSVSPSRSPVITAEPSAREPPRPSVRSTSSAPKAAATITRRALTPKNHPDAAMIGTKEPATFHMMTGVESWERTCGDAVTINLGASGALMRYLPSHGAAPPCWPGRAVPAEYSTGRRRHTSRRACSRRGADRPYRRSASPGRDPRATTG